MEKIQRYQNIPEERAIQKKRAVVLFSILIQLVVFIFIILNALILKISNEYTNKTQTKDNSEARLASSSYLCSVEEGGASAGDTVCSTQEGCIYSPKTPQEWSKNTSQTSSSGMASATLFEKEKRLMYSLKNTILATKALLKYRFSQFRAQLEENQRKSLEKTKLYQKEDTLFFTQGLVMGEKTTSNSFVEVFQQAGMVHILVASGFNIALVAGVLEKIVSFLSKGAKFTVLVVGIWSYIWFLEGDAPLLRAGVMLSFFLTVQFFGFKISSRRILLLSGVFLVIFSPTLLFSLSFWFSFLATAGLVLLSNTFSSFLPQEKEGSSLFSPGVLFFQAEAWHSFVAQLFIFPLVVFFFSQVQWHSFITNMLLLFPVAYFTQVGMFSLSSLLFLFTFSPRLSSVFTQVFAPFYWIYEFLFEIFLNITRRFNGLFFLEQSVFPEQKIWLLVCWLLCISVVFAWKRREFSQKRGFFHEIV